MTRRFPLNPYRVFVVVLAALLPGLPLFGQDVIRPNDAARQTVGQMKAALGGEVDATYSRLTGFVTFLTTGPGKGVPVPDPAATSPEDRARSFLDSYGSAFGLGPESDLRVTRVDRADVIGADHVRFQQFHRGVPVTAGELIVHLEGAAVVALNGKLLPKVVVDVVPTVSASEALDAVRELVKKHLTTNPVELSEPELQILNRGLLEGVQKPTRLTWFMVATNAELREFVWVDAGRGGIALHFSQRRVAAQGETNQGVRQTALIA